MQQREKLYEDIKHFIVNVGWTHKIHIVYSDKLSFWGNFCQVVQVVSSSITASGIAAIILGKGSECYNIVIALISFITLLVTGIDKVLDISKLSVKEKYVANHFWKLREEGLKLLSTIQYQTDDIENVQIRYEELIDLRNKYNNDLSNVPKRYVNEASRLLKLRKDNDYSNDFKYFIPDRLIELRKEEK